MTLSDEVLKKEIYQGYLNKFKNRLYGLLCEREKKGEWKKYLDTIITELMGYKEEEKTINYYILFYKISSLRFLEYDYFRKTVFECMHLIDNLDSGGEINGIL